MKPKHARFCTEYLIDLNAAQAAIRAGYSPKGADRQGARLLRKPTIAAAVKAAQDERATRTQVKQDRVVRELARLAFSALTDVVEWTKSGLVTVKPSPELTEEQVAAIAEISLVGGANGPTLRVKMHDKVAALQALARHLGMFKDKVELGAAPAGEPTAFAGAVRAGFAAFAAGVRPRGAQTRGGLPASLVTKRWIVTGCPKPVSVGSGIITVPSHGVGSRAQRASRGGAARPVKSAQLGSGPRLPYVGARPALARPRRRAGQRSHARPPCQR